MASSIFPSSSFGRSSPNSGLNVQELAKQPLAKVPQIFLLEDSKRPGRVLKSAARPPNIPVIDMKRLSGNETTSTDIMVDELHSVCQDWGFFQLVNHGVSCSVLENLKEEMVEFYKLPLREKMKYKTADDAEGYGQTMLRSGDKKLDWGDRFYMITNPIHERKPHLLPKLPPSLRDNLEVYISEAQKVAERLLWLMAKNIKLEEGEMEELFDNGRQAVRMNYYPPCPQSDMVLGLSPHSDPTGITMLLQVNGVDGLQIKKDGVWIPVNVLPNALVVNVGDILEIVSNGMYSSIEHRATVNRTKERISIAMSFSPKLSAEIGPAHGLITPQNPPLYKRVGVEKYYKDFFSRKLDGKSYLEHMKIKKDVQDRSLENE